MAYDELKEMVEEMQSVRLQDGHRHMRKFGRGTCWAKQTKTALMTQGSSPIATETLTTANLVDTLSSTTANTATISVQASR